MQFLLRNIRIIVAVVAAVVAVGIYLYFASISHSPRILTIRLTQAYAFASVIFLYLTLLASPLYLAFPTIPTKTIHLRARKALGISTFFFGCLHASIGFFFQLGGFPGLPFLTQNYLTAVSLGASSLTILLILTITSYKPLIRRLGMWWKPLHRLAYVVGFLTIIHALMLGTHFANLSTLIPQLFFLALLILFILEALRMDRYVTSKLQVVPRYILFTLMGAVLMVFSYYFYFYLAEEQALLGIHAKHLANRASAEPGRFKAEVVEGSQLEVNTPTTLAFRIIDTKTGNPVKNFDVLFEKVIHLIILDSSLTYFSHLHPEWSEDGFSVEVTLPKDGVYYAYLDFQPTGLVEQQTSFLLTVGTGGKKPSIQSVDTNLTKRFGTYEVKFSSNGKLRASKMGRGTQLLTFTLEDTTTRKPITDLEPYLGSFGHLVLVNQKTYQYVHVHPRSAAIPKTKGGPSVSFLPLSLAEPIEKGTYRAFAQFKRGGELFVVDYTLLVQ